MSQPAMATEGLTKRFGKTTAVNGLDVHVPQGCVYGFLGRNGAGKTTTIKMLLGLLAPTTGTVSVLGLTPGKEDTKIKRRVGYVAEHQKMYGWMTVRETAEFCASFYKTWNDALCEDLLARLELPPDRKLRALSRGMQAKVALALALSHEPELLILDDPTSGLDAVVRREFMESIIGLLHEEGRTVFFSSHMLDEVERVADRVGIIDQGKMLLDLPKEEMKSAFRRVSVVFDGDVPRDLPLKGVLDTKASAHELTATVRDFGPEQERQLRDLGAQSIHLSDLSLEDIFVALVGTRRSNDESPAS